MKNTEKQNFENLLAMLPQKEEPLLAIAESEPDRADWILLQENSHELNKAHASANKSLAAISELHSLCGIDSFDSLLKAQTNVKLFIQGEMLKNETLKTLSQSIDINLLNVPPGLQRAEALLSNVFDKQFLFFENNEWQIDFERLEDYLEQFRKYAKTDEQIEKFHLTNQVCVYLNSINMGTYSKHGFMSRMVQLDLTNGFVPDPNWILSSNATDYKN